ncbi:5129_t:CDS:2 [Rhizophagus irregularis]|nr:5129_t:CDS:2 [Rhizophagus irregularis]
MREEGCSIHWKYAQKSADEHHKPFSECGRLTRSVSGRCPAHIKGRLEQWKIILPDFNNIVENPFEYEIMNASSRLYSALNNNYITTTAKCTNYK